MTVDGAYFFVRVQAEQGLIVKNHTAALTHTVRMLYFSFGCEPPKVNQVVYKFWFQFH